MKSPVYRLHPVLLPAATAVIAFWAAIAVGGTVDFTADNKLTPADEAKGWILLFDGQSLAGWRSYKKPGPPAKGWVVEDGCLHHRPKGGGGDIITDKDYDNFEVEWDWKVAPGANSGLKYLVPETRSAPLGHEYQLIDDNLHEDALRGPKWQTGSFYDVLPPTNKVLNAVGTFNHSRVVIQGNHVEHWLNGREVLTYELGSPEVLAAVAKSKFKNTSRFGTKFPGHLLLQDHGDEIWFKNIKLRPLPGPASGQP
jgi:hypothetical protein